MHSGVRNVWNEGFVHKMKPERTPHAVGETGVWRKGEVESVKSDRDDGSVLSRAEDGGADADYGGAVTDGQGPVVGHADGKFREVGQLRITGIQTLLEGLDAGEIRLHDGCVVGVSGHAHEAVYADMGVGTSGGIFIKDGLYLLLGEAALGEFGTQMELKQHIDHTGVDRSPVVDQIQKVTGIHGLHQRGVRKDQLQLIGLEMADEMPFDVLRQLESLLGELLRTVLTETALSGLVGCQYVLERMEFGNCHQLDS